MVHQNGGRVKLIFSQLMKGNVDPVEYHENPVVTSKGAEKTIAFHNTILQDGDNEITGILFSGEDITPFSSTTPRARK